MGNDVELSVKLANHGIVNVSEALETEIFTGNNGGDELLAFEQVDGGSLGSIGSMQATNKGVARFKINITRERAFGEAQYGAVLSVTGESSQFLNSAGQPRQYASRRVQW